MTRIKSRSGVVKRGAAVPRDARLLGAVVSKADLLEAALSLAGLCSESDSADDGPAALDRLHEELQALRTSRGAKPIPELTAMIARRDRIAAEHAARMTPEGRAKMRADHAAAVAARRVEAS